MPKAVLVVFRGLPGTGKSTIARGVANKTGAFWIRVDTIEQALMRAGEVHRPPQVSGYEIAYALARDNLRSGQIVVADSVNPIKLTQMAWQEVGLELGAICLEIEIVCSDKKAHQTRVEGRMPDIEGHVVPTWDEVVAREYENFRSADIIVDTAVLNETKAIDMVLSAILARRGEPIQ